jgi:hypothetical protein
VGGKVCEQVGERISGRERVCGQVGERMSGQVRE